MIHYKGNKFNKCFEKLPANIQEAANKNFALLKKNPYDPVLNFKKVKNFWSVRVNHTYRSLAIEDAGCFIWFWIGHHDMYDKILAR